MLPAVAPEMAILTAVVFFASLLAHELAHSLVALRYGLRVEKITLWIFGGVSQLSGDVPSPGAEVWIAGVGPLTSLVLGGILIGAAAGFATTHPASASVAGVFETALAYLGFTNVALAVFNVIPAAPLDGGRLLRAVVWWRTGDRVKATVWASRAGQVFGWLFIVGGLYTFFATRQWTWLWFAFIGWFLVSAATSEAQQAVVTGLVTINRIRQVPAAERDRTTLADIACPLADVATAAPGDSVADLLPRLTACADRRALVFSDGRLAGIISPSDIARMLDRINTGSGAAKRPTEETLGR
jgi:Zn-dependent protease